MEDWESAPLLEQPKKEAWESAPVLVDASGKAGKGGFRGALDLVSDLSMPVKSLKMATAVGDKIRSAIGWERPDPRPQQRVASGVIDALRAGYQGSATGLAVRESLPDIVLDASHSKWYEELASSVGHVVSEAPWNVAGFALAGTAGLPTGPGALALGGAGATALPAAVRESLTQSYMKGEVASVSDFLERTAIVLNVAGKEGAVGALAGPAGAEAKMAAAPLGKVASTIVGGAAEVGTMVVTPAMIEGRLPERKEFTHAAVLMFGLKGAHAGTNLLFKTFEKTGKPPIQVLEEANANPALKAELMQQLEVFQREAEGLPIEAGPKPFKSTVDIVDNTSYQGQRQGPLLGPNDQHLVARDPANGKDIGRLWVTQTETGFEVRKVEVDPASRGKDVATQLYVEARNRFGPYEGGTDLTPDGMKLQERLRQTHPEVFTAGEPVAMTGYPELPPAYRQQAAEMAAAEAFPGTKAQAQQVLDHPFADIPDTKLPHQLNMRWIEAPEDIRALQTRMAETYKAEIDMARGGTQSWAEIEQKAAQQVASMTGQDLAKVLAERKVGDTDNAVQLKVRGDILMQAASEAAEAVQKLKTAGRDATEAMKLDALQKIHKSAMVQADFTGASSELGRALGYLRSIKQVQDQAAGFGKLVEMYGKNTDKILEQAKLMDTPESMSAFAKRLNKATTEKQLLELWKAGLVSGPWTHAANITGNLTQMATKPIIETMAASYGLMPWAKAPVEFSEPVFRIIGQKMASVDALKLAWKAMKVDAESAKTNSNQAIPGTKGKIVRTAFRVLEAEDAFFRTLVERGEAYALAAKQASKEGYNPLTREFAERVQELGNNPPESYMDAIQKAGERATFTSPLGEKGQAVSEAIVKVHGEWVVPFRGTPANIMKEMIRMSPAAPIIGEWRAAMAEGGASAHKAMAEMVFGTAISSTVVGLAMHGLMTGNGDPDPNKRRVQAAAGWQPYSVKIDGKYYSYQRIQPIGTLMGMAADVAEVWKYLTADESDKVVKMLGVAFANAVTKQSMLQGIATFTEALSSPDRKAGRFMQNFIGSWVPAAVGQTAQIMDDYQREVNSIREAVMNRIPGLREELPPTRDPFGEPVKNPDRLGAITIREESKDKVRTEAARLKIGQAEAPKSITLPHGGLGGDIGKVELTPKQRDIFGEVAGKAAYAELSKIVNSPAWDFISDPEQAIIFKKVFERTNQLGKAKALNPEELEAAIQKTLKDVQEELKKKRTSD